MTFSQLIIYEGIKKYYKANGCMPTLRELANICSLSSRSNISVHLHNLEKLGYIEIIKNKKRGIILKGDGNNG